MIGAIWSVRWNNPYTDPPDGWPRVLIEVFRPEGHFEVRAHPPAAIRQIMDEIGPGNGYGLHWQPISEPPKTTSPEKLAKIRRQRLERRVHKKYPLLADQIIAEEMLKKAEYYAGITDPNLMTARAEVIENEKRKIAQLIAAYKNEIKEEEK